jgi:DNA polymerase-3 subunit delta'
MTDTPYPWLAELCASARAAYERGRLGHALLVHGSAGLGSNELARWLAALVLCDAPSARPCGKCASCTLLCAGNHPDFHWVEREREGEKEAKQLKVELIRELATALTLKSYRGGYKAAVLAEADAMNPNAANALLKTLEEPAPQTLLVLCSARPSRLPATILSRCQRLEIVRPATERALGWLGATRASGAWPETLQYAAGEPLRALELEASGFAELDEEMRAALDRLRSGALDIPGTAERWSRSVLDRRLMWLDVWVTRVIRQAFVPGSPLPSSAGRPNIRALYGLLDRVRSFRLELDTSLNLQLATEVLLLNAENVLAN